MAITDLFKKKRKDDFMEVDAPRYGSYGPSGFPGEAQMGRGPPPMAAQPMDMGLQGMPPEPQMGFPAGGVDLKRDIETLSYKLDNLKSAMDNISARLASIESALRTQPTSEKSESGWTY